MGCQNSKLNADVLAIPPKLRPILWRKVEELRNRRRNGVVNGTTISKKELLKDGKVYMLPSSVDENESRKSISLEDDSVSSSGSRPKPVKEETKMETMEEKTEEEDKDSAVVKVEALEKMVVVEEEEEKENEEEEMEEEEDEERGNLCPGSPSFRVFFVESSLGEKDDVKNDSKDENHMKQKWGSANSADSIVILETHEEEEEQETKVIKKRMKNRTRITRAICRGPVAVKHLLSSSSCYHPSNDRDSLLNKKPATT
ncbi:uncharacterized protein LOC115709628 [Cannabis sativa]|uniref:uncharacterized protein LOC115709628 n=1 Tax=Cannabis sativa TaxID=3483 RepID=UPI0029CA61FF|nr:uncharacterized protein LOC115709628 [Cannabis sativa]